MTKDIIKGAASFCAVGALMGAGVLGMVASSSALDGDTEPTPNPAKGLAKISTMQEMTGEVCWHTPLHTEKQLTDTRDGKSYFVAKLADGNCWMTQNLDYDLKEGAVLTSADSDVQDSWTVPESVANYEYNNYDIVYDWSKSQYVIKNPSSNDGCEDTSLISKCSEYVQDISSMAPGYKATATSSISEDGKSYDAHYLIGHYYTAKAVTAQDKGSICPKGWKMPMQISESGGFDKLIKSYGNPSEDKGFIVLAPIYITRSGLVYNSDTLSKVGKEADYWYGEGQSSIFASSAPFFDSDSSNINTSSHYAQKNHGLSARCLAPSVVDYSGDDNTGGENNNGDNGNGDNGNTGGDNNNGDGDNNSGDSGNNIAGDNNNSNTNGDNTSSLGNNTNNTNTSNPGNNNGNTPGGTSNSSNTGNNANQNLSVASASETDTYKKAPNTGSMSAKQQSARTTFALATVATVAGLAGMVILVKLYFFSPLKRKK